ncbi:hypothetical protein AAC387_Pa08g1459 [Persea americana]
MWCPFETCFWIFISLSYLFHSRGNAFRFGVPRASAAPSEVFCGDLEHGVDNHGHSSIKPFTIIQPKRFYQGPSVPTKFFFGTQCLSSQAGTKSSGDEDDLEDGFSELETPLGNETAAGNNVGEEAAEDLISEPELSDADLADDLSEAVSDVLDLSDDEPSYMRAVKSAIDKWVEEGNTLGRTEMSVAMLNLWKRRMFGRALQLSECVEANKRVEFVEQDYASRVDLIAKVHGLHKAEKYAEKVPQSFQGEVICRTLLANCASLNVKKTEELFNKMRDLGFPLTPFSCNQLLLLYKRVDRKKIVDVLLLMEKENVIETMQSDGLEPDLLTQAMVARYYAFGGLHEKAEVCEVSPRLDECLAAIEAWGTCGRVDNAEDVFENMLKTWNKVSAKYYTALLKVYANHKMLAKGKDDVKQMSDNGYQIGPYRWDALVKLYLEAGEVEKAGSIFVTTWA